MFQARKTVLEKCIQKASLEHMLIASQQTTPKSLVTDFITDKAECSWYLDLFQVNRQKHITTYL